jgi:CheY-like chemotaxis protein
LTETVKKSKIFHNLDVLLADDIPAICLVLKEMLRRLGVGGRIDAAADGREAWDLLQNRPYSLVISDINMPRMNGLELQKLMRQSNRYEKTPLLLVTGEVSEDILNRVMQSEWDAYLPKPIKINNLAHYFHSLLKRREISAMGTDGNY